MMLQTATRKIYVYEVQITDIKEKVKFSCELNRIEKSVLMSVPRHKELIKAHEHLRRVYMNDEEEKALLPVHRILGASEMSRIKTSEPATVGDDGMPVAEKTTLGWTIISPGQEMNHSYLVFAKSSQEDYMQLWSLDVLGLEDRPEGDQGNVHPELPTNYHIAR